MGLFSGGKDSLVTCHYLWKLGLLNEVLFCHTGVGVKENFQFVLETCNKFGWKLNVVYPKTGETFEDFVRKFGFPKQGAHNIVMGFLKWHPMRRWYREHQSEGIALVSGRRKKESQRRAKMKSMKDPISLEEMMLFVAPLYHLPDSVIWNYIATNKLARCPVYETMHISGDCLCGSFSESGEAELLTIFHPETAKSLHALEEKYGGMWGNGSSMRGAKKQSQLTEYQENLVCAECFIDRKKKA